MRPFFTIWWLEVHDGRDLIDLTDSFQVDGTKSFLIIFSTVVVPCERTEVS